MLPFGTLYSVGWRENLKICLIFLQAMMEHCHYLEEQLDAYKGKINLHMQSCILHSYDIV